MVQTLKVRLSSIDTDYTLRSLLVMSGLGTSEFARVVGVSRETISRMCCKKVETPRYLMLAALSVCNAAGIGIVYMEPARELAMAAKTREENQLT
jgi:transcriptional regulator with XRE-family HTH domain